MMAIVVADSVVCVSISMGVCVCVYIYIYIYIYMTARVSEMNYTKSV